MSWVALDDLLGILLFAVQNDAVEGPLNAVSPNPVTNREWTEALGKVLGRPTLFPLPETVAKALFGEMAEETLLSSCRALPGALEKKGFVFRHPELFQALKEMIP